MLFFTFNPILVYLDFKQQKSKEMALYEFSSYGNNALAQEI